MIVALAATWLVLDDSIATAMKGIIFVFYATPFLSLAFVIWAVAGRGLADRPRRATMAATIFLVCGAWSLLRLDSMVISEGAKFAWRWTETSEERFLAQAADDRKARQPTSGEKASGPIWSGFRGPDRNSVIRNVTYRDRLDDLTTRGALETHHRAGLVVLRR